MQRQMLATPMLCASSCERELTATLHSEQYRSFLAFSSSDSTLGSDGAAGSDAGLEVFFRATACPVGSVGGLACAGAVLQGLGTNATAGAAELAQGLRGGRDNERSQRLCAFLWEHEREREKETRKEQIWQLVVKGSACCIVHWHIFQLLPVYFFQYCGLGFDIRPFAARQAL